MVRYSFLVGLFHPRLHAGLSRRLRMLTHGGSVAPVRTRAALTDGLRLALITYSKGAPFYNAFTSSTTNRVKFPRDI